MRLVPGVAFRTSLVRGLRAAGSLPWLVLAVSLLLTFALWLGALQGSFRALKVDFDHRVREVENRIERRMNAYEQILRGAVGLFASSPDPSRSQFRRYVATLGLEEHYPGIQAVGFVRLVPAEEKASHEASVRGEGLSAYSVHPEGTRVFHAPVCYIEPFSGRNLRVLGFDLTSEQERREAAEKARDEARAVITGKVRLQQETGREEQAGTIMLLPVYRDGAPPATVDERRAEIVGWVFGTFRMGDLMMGLIGERGVELDIEIYDGAAVSGKSLLYDGEKDPPDLAEAPGQQVVRTLEVAGHTWTVVVRSLPAFESRLATGRPRLVAASGIGGSVLFSLLIGTLVRGRRLALEAADEIRRSERRFRSTFQAPRVGLAITSVEKGWLEVNDHLCVFLGYSREELSRRTWAELTHPEDLEADADRFRRVLAGEIDAYSMEKRYLRKGGEAIWALLSVACARRSDGSVDFFVAVIHDLSERKVAEEALLRERDLLRQAEREIRSLNAELEARVATRTAELESALGEMESFSYSVAHDLRAPIRAIDGYATLLAEHLGSAADEDARRLLASVKQNSLRMGRLIDDLLDFSRTGRMELKKRRVDMAELARQVVAEVVSPGSRGSLEVRVANLPPADADPRLVEVVLRNLVSNAVKFSGPRERPVVEIGWGSDGGVPEYFVRDNGVGFDQRYAHKLFGVFQRLHGMNEFEGTGIGLALVGRIVGRHGGRVRAEGETGRGAAIFFTLGPS